MRTSLLAALLVSAAASVADAQISTTPTFFQIDPRTSFYRTSSDAPLSPYIISLSGIAAGSTLRLSSSGQVQAAGIGSPVLPMQDNYYTALFSSSNTVLGTEQLNRVPGALPLPGGLTSLVTVPTLHGRFSTDIAQDFGILRDGMNVLVPERAQYLMISWYDDYYADNVSPDPAQLGVTISFARGSASTVPEPSTCMLLGTGFLVLGGVAARRRRATS